MPFLVLLVLAIPILAIVAVVVAARTARRLDEVQREVRRLQGRLAERVTALELGRGGAPAPAHAPAEAPGPTTVVAATPPPTRPSSVSTPSPFEAPPPAVARPTRVRAPEPASEKVPLLPVRTFTVAPGDAVAVEEPVTAPRGSLEARIGGKWFNWIGILALLLGVSYLLKYAFEQGWISPWMQFLGGVGLGLVLLELGVLSHARKYPILAHGFFGGGIAILFLTWFAGYRVHGILAQSVAFAGMAATTLVGAALAIRLRSPTVASFAALGGYLTPILLGDTAPNQVFLFTYLFILTAGLLGVGAWRGWRFLLPLSFFAVLVYVAMWWFQFFPGDPAWTLGTLVAFFFLFSWEPALAACRPGARVGPLDLTVLALNTALALVALHQVLLRLAPDLRGALYVLAAVHHAGLALAVRRRGAAGAEIARWLGHGAAVLLLLAPWMEPSLSGPGRTLAWSALALVLFEASIVAGASARQWGLAALLFAGGRLLAWNAPRELLHVDPYVPLWNGRGLVFLAVTAPFLVVARLYARFGQPRSSEERAAAALVGASAVAMPLVLLSLEARDAMHAWLLPAASSAAAFRMDAALVMTLLWAVYGTVAAVVAHRRGVPLLRGLALAFLVGVLAKLVVHDLAIWGVVVDSPLLNFRFVVMLALAAMAFRLGRELRSLAPTVVAHVLALGAACLEWHDAFVGGEAAWAGLWALAAVHGAALVVWGARRDAAVLLRTGLVFLVGGLWGWAARAVFGDPLVGPLLGNPRAAAGAVVALSLFVAARAVRSRPEAGWARAALLLAGHACVVTLLTREAHDALQLRDGRSPAPAWLELRHARQLSYSLIWSLYSIGLVLVGFRTRFRPLRLAALGFLMVTIVKVFLVDLSFLENPYRILSFIVLGAILVGVSYLYQRYRALLVG